MRKILIDVGVIFLLLFSTNVQSLASDNLIYACTNKEKIRIVVSPSECRKNETAIYWNMVGPQGPKGDKGEQGIAGLDGVNCWDLNENLTCDTEEEDKNNDGICNASDCQGIPGSGSIQVYDADGQFVGILVDLLGDIIFPVLISHLIKPIFFPI